MTLQTNTGDRPSRFAADRHLTGEHTDPAVQAWLDTPAGRAHLAELTGARKALPPLDVAALRRRSAPAANNTRFFALLVPILLAAAAALFVLLPGPVDPTYVGVRGSALSVFHLDQGALNPYDNRALGAGDVLGFQVDPGAREGVVLLSIDGTGTLTVHYPSSGQREPVSGPSALPGSIVLDGAPGPEVFVAFFGTDVTTARAEATAAWQSGGMQGLLDLAGGPRDVAVVNRR